LIFTFPPKPSDIGRAVHGTGYRDIQSQCSGSLGAEAVSRTRENPATINLEDVAKGATPYAMFDDNRTGSASRSRRLSHTPSIDCIDPDPAGNFREPVQTSTEPSNAGLHNHGLRSDLVPLKDMTFDPRTLNMHLTLRVQEVLACTEEMWQFVRDYQEKYLPATEKNSRTEQSQSDSAQVVIRPQPADPFHEELVQMQRGDFDGMITRYRL
jgi:hypothetical protein